MSKNKIKYLHLVKWRQVTAQFVELIMTNFTFVHHVSGFCRCCGSRERRQDKFDVWSRINPPDSWWSSSLHHGDRWPGQLNYDDSWLLFDQHNIYEAKQTSLGFFSHWLGTNTTSYSLSILLQEDVIFYSNTLFSKSDKREFFEFDYI